MLGVSAVRSASGAAGYFAKDDYYTAEHSAEASAWGGAGAAHLGLEGEVDKDDFERALGGVLPSGEAVGQVEHRQYGTDLTFSMPKSASIMAYVAGDARILAANMAAVRATMGWIERNLAEGRKDVSGRKIPVRTGNLVYALFQHDTSRALDPQGHVHAVVANLTRMPGGRMQALHNGAIWRANTTIGSVYHAYLRAGLERLGYHVVAGGKHGAFEIKGVPRAIVDAFSQRRETILSKAAELGLNSPQARDGVAVTTRDPKLAMTDRAALRNAWAEKATTLGFDGRALAAPAHARVLGQHGGLIGGYRAVAAAVDGARTALGDLLRPHDPLVDRTIGRAARSPEDARAQLAVASAVRILAQREAAFATAALTKTALDLGLRGVTADRIDARVAALVRSGRLVPEVSRRHDGAVDLVTTAEALRTEEGILAAVAAGRGNARVLLPEGQALAKLEAVAAQPLNPGQLAAAILAVSSSDQVVLVQGIAGAGKSTMLQAVARVAQGEGRRVLGLAFQNKMVADLANGAGIESRTIAAFIQQHEHAGAGAGAAAAVSAAALRDTLVVVDETSMVSSNDMLRLLQISAALGVERLLLVGDRQQLASIDAGKAFALIQAGGGATARMDENLRQRTEQLRVVAALANRGATTAAMKVLGGDVVEHLSPAVHAADRWLALGEDERARTSVFASGHAARATINARIQQGLIAEGKISGEGIALTVLERVNHTREELRHSLTYRPGQILAVAQAVPELGLGKGQFEVVGLDQRGRVRVSDGRRHYRFDPQRLRPGEARDRLQLAERKALHLREGDRIRWTANDKPRGLHNSALARVLSAGADGVLVETASAERLLLQTGDPMLQRIDLAYSLNMHMAQGMTTDRAITVMSSTERHLSNQRLFNVGVTRVRDQLTLVVDDRAKLERQLAHTTGDKTSALEITGRVDIDRRERTVRRSPDGSGQARPGSGLDSWRRLVAPKEERGGKGLGLSDNEVRTLPPLPERRLSLDL